MTDKQLCLILGSDGVSTVMRNNQLVQIVRTYEKLGPSKDGRLQNHSRLLLRYTLRAWGTMRADNISLITDGRLQNHSRLLLRYTLRAWGTMRADNISLITVIFDKPDTVFQSTAILNSDDNMNLDAALTEYENSAIVIGPEHCQQIETLPIDLFYIGLTDPLRAVMEYKGPGFVRDIKKTLDYIEVPVVPAATPRILSVSELLALTRRPDNACGVAVEKPKDESIAETTQEHKKDDENMICATVVVDLQGKISTIDNNPTNSEV
ncbi:unnamed protein product [Gongylonema pulchrum]|uniref:Uncharacterized protein n=1 Tax=Gongylonema pulchrum TaxID=637853 RepID=A0A3P7Q950_9BILA|nr:unnamed protein product [Gongylonema pulchrum]